MVVFALVEANGMGVSSRRLLGWSSWILTFILANGRFEELMFRGLFLKKFEPFLGATLASVLTGFVFAAGHAGVTYTADILVFVAITFVFALIGGYLMQKTGAVWGSALFHAGADTLIMIGIFAGVKNVTSSVPDLRKKFGASEDDGGVAANGGCHGTEP